MERPKFQRVLDSVANYSRDHGGRTSASLIAGGLIVEQAPVPGRELVSFPLILTGGIIGGLNTLLDNSNRAIALERSMSFQEEETNANDISKPQ